MANEGAGEEGRGDFGDRLVAVTPLAAVEGVHEFRLAGKDADRQPAADHLSVRREIGPDSGHGLHPAGMSAEAGDDLIHDEGDARIRSDLAKRRAEIRTAADRDGGSAPARR